MKGIRDELKGTYRLKQNAVLGAVSFCFKASRHCETKRIVFVKRYSIRDGSDADGIFVRNREKRLIIPIPESTCSGRKTARR